MMLQWTLVEWAECPECGCPEAEVLTGESGIVYGQEEARCPECGLKGTTRVDEDGEAWISWEGDG